MVKETVCDFCGKRITYLNEPNRVMEYRHDSYCTDGNGEKQHVGDETYDHIDIAVDVFDKGHNKLDVCKDCLFEIINQM